ncbi:MAG: transposase [Chloroflexi bacterium]|nr:transposase [Chloroflexota bacterium]
MTRDCGCRCPFKPHCTKAKGNRSIRISFRMMAYRDQARNNLTSGKGIRLRSERCIEVGTVFGQIKHNTGFRRFMVSCHFLFLPTISFLVSFRGRFEVHSRQPPVAFFPI